MIEIKSGDIRISILDEPSKDGSHHLYDICGYDPRKNPNYCKPVMINQILFQHGDVNKCGNNGITNEALIRVVIHRLECLKCPTSADERALTFLYAALGILELKECHEHRDECDKHEDDRH